MNFKFAFLILFLLSSKKIYAQRHQVENHAEHKNEIGIANAPVYFLNNKTLAYGLHLHYVRHISNTKFGIGVGFEQIFGKDKHQTYGLVGVYNPIEKLSLSLSPGLTFEDGNKIPRASLHAETSYELEVGNYHIGPAFEFAYDQEDYHISLGLHIGLGF